MTVKAPNFYGLVILKNKNTKKYIDEIKLNHKSMLETIKKASPEGADLPSFIDEDDNLFSDSVAIKPSDLPEAVKHAKSKGLKYSIDFTTFGLGSGIDPVPWANVTTVGKTHTISFVEN